MGLPAGAHWLAKLAAILIHTLNEAEHAWEDSFRKVTTRLVADSFRKITNRLVADSFRKVTTRLAEITYHTAKRDDML